MDRLSSFTPLFPGRPKKSCIDGFTDEIAGRQTFAQTARRGQPLALLPGHSSKILEEPTKENPQRWLSPRSGYQVHLKTKEPKSSVGPAFQHAIIKAMEVGNIRLYRDRWQAVEEIERQELRAMTPEEHWRKLNALARFAMEAGMPLDHEAEEMKVFLRWAELKAQYEAGQ